MSFTDRLQKLASETNEKELHQINKSKSDKAAQWGHIKTEMPELAEFMTGFSNKTTELFGQGKKAFAAVETFESGNSYVTGQFDEPKRFFDGKIRKLPEQRRFYK